MAAGLMLVKDSNGSYCAAQWMEGEPEKSMWTGLKTRGRELLPVISYRCARCAMVESYAEG